MANISEVTLPDGNDYDIKAKYLDSTARNDILSMASKINETVITTPYVKKMVPFGQYTEKLKKLVGASVVWNQLVKNGNFVDTSNWSYSGSRWTLSVSSNVATLTVTAAGTKHFLQEIAFTAGHQLLISFEAKSSIASALSCSMNSASYSTDNLFDGETLGTNYKKITRIFTATVNSNALRIGYRESTSIATGGSLSLKNVTITDLTTMFGSAIADYVNALETQTAGSGIAWLKSYGFFTEDYYAYSANTMQSVSVSGKKNWSRNRINVNTITKLIRQGSETTSGITNEGGIITVSKQYGPSGQYALSQTIPVTNGSVTISADFMMTGTDVTNKLIRTLIMDPTSTSSATSESAKSITMSALNTWEHHSVTYALGSNVISGFCTVLQPWYAGTTIKIKNLQVEVGTSKSEYSPYGVIGEYPLDHTELRGIFKLDANNNLYADGDEYNPDGSEDVKFGLVPNLGGLTWDRVTTSTDHWRFRATLSDAKRAASASSVPNILCPKYITVTPGNTWSNITGITIANDASYIFACDESITTGADFKTAMNEIPLLYELTTPTTAALTPYTSLQNIEGGGIEEFIDYGVEQGTRDVAIPVGNETVYGDNPIIAEYIKYLS